MKDYKEILKKETIKKFIELECKELEVVVKINIQSYCNEFGEKCSITTIIEDY